MVTELKLVISNNDKIVHTLTKELNSTRPLVMAIEQFKSETNELLTKMIEEKSHAGNQDTNTNDCDDDEDNEESEDDIPIKPKKRKK